MEGPERELVLQKAIFTRSPERRFLSLFEPVHGSAPDIYDKNTAHPIAMIGSAALMLDFLGLGARPGRRMCGRSIPSGWSAAAGRGPVSVSLRHTLSAS
ncbi:hypothetical protein GCM10027321_31980 [Massilia terrae]